MNEKPPLKEWLICWDCEKLPTPDSKWPDNVIYLAYYDEDETGSFWMVEERGGNIQCEVPKNWRRIPMQVGDFGPYPNKEAK